jgi:hypothetical protein
MKYINLKPAFIIYLIINSLTAIFSQNNAVTHCDTLFLKSGKMQFVNINKIENDFISFYECGTKDASIAFISKTEVIAIKRSNTRMENRQQLPEYELIKQHKKWYIEGSFDVTTPLVSSVKWTPKISGIDNSKSYIIIGLGASLSAGYQFHKWAGLGLTAKTSYAWFDIPDLTFRSLSMNYRLDFDAIKVDFNYGYVSGISHVASEGCETFDFDKSKPHSIFGVSGKLYTKRFVVLGLGVFFTQLPYSESCKSNVATVFTTTQRNWDIFEVKFSLGFYGPGRFSRVAVDN